MKQSRFTDSQVIESLKRAESGLAVPEICREPGISPATFYQWREKYGGMDASLIARMKELEAGNARLRKMVHRREDQGRDRPGGIGKKC